MKTMSEDWGRVDVGVKLLNAILKRNKVAAASWFQKKTKKTAWEDGKNV